MKILSAAFMLAFLLCAAQASAASVCTLFAPGQVEAALGAKITAKSELRGEISIACNYELAGGAGGPGFFSLQRFTVPVPPVDAYKMVMHTPKSNIVPVPGIGDKALIIDDTYEMIVHKGPAVYNFGVRGVPCENRFSQQESKRCANVRMMMLKAIGALVAES